MSEYTRKATREELEALNKEEWETLRNKLIVAEMLVDDVTFTPYKVVEGVRYSLEIIVGR